MLLQLQPSLVMMISMMFVALKGLWPFVVVFSSYILNSKWSLDIAMGALPLVGL